MKKKAFITGITGQDGSYLAELLLDKNYEVHGIKRRSSSFNTQRIDHIFQDPNDLNSGLKLYFGDLTDVSGLTRLLGMIQPDEIYNLGAQSHVAVSFEMPEYTADVGAMGTLRLLEAMRAAGLQNKARFYQASTSELYGLVQETPQTEKTPFYPRSPYAVSKLHSFWTVVNYREAYGMFACNGILFNHESPRRGETFVTRKISMGISRIDQGLLDCIFLGNLDAKRDWGHAKDFVEMQWLMLQQDRPRDFVISTGVQHSVREFVQWACEYLGFRIEFSGEGLQEVGIVSELLDDRERYITIGDIIVRVSKRYYRPTEVESLLGDSSKAQRLLGWYPKISAKDLCKEMVEADLKRAKEERLLLEHNEK